MVCQASKVVWTAFLSQSSGGKTESQETTGKPTLGKKVYK